ncbi:hypothetical protein M0802_009846 [Mischocyttarus mexicanus]|nr:hypothetical protein M0802_009846 [Mischocyttarus mexicanus]
MAKIDVANYEVFNGQMEKHNPRWM